MTIDYSLPLIRGCSDFFRLPVVTSTTATITLAAETDLTSPLYKIDEIDGFSREIYPALKPDATAHPDALWLGAMNPDGSERDPNPEYVEVLRGNTRVVHARTLAGAKPQRRANLYYGGVAAIENAFALPGGSSGVYLFEGLQSDTPNLLEPEYALLELIYNYFNPAYVRAWLYFCGNFEAAKFKHNGDAQTFEMVYNAIRGKDGSGVPFTENFALSRRWAVALSTPGTPITYR